MRVVLGISIQDKRQWLTQVSSWQPEEAPGVLGNNVGSLPEPGFKGAKSTKTWGPVVTFRAISSISVGAVDLNSIFPHSTEFQAPSTPSLLTLRNMLLFRPIWKGFRFHPIPAVTLQRNALRTWCTSFPHWVHRGVALP